MTYEGGDELLQEVGISHQPKAFVASSKLSLNSLGRKRQVGSVKHQEHRLDPAPLRVTAFADSVSRAYWIHDSAKAESITFRVCKS